MGLNGNPVTLHGLGTTCTEYLLRGIGMKCWPTYTWSDPKNIITALDTAELDSIINYLTAKKSSTVVPAVRIPTTASSWLNATTKASAGNKAKYPDLNGQYRALITKMVNYYTSAGIVAIVDLHWNDDDTEQQPMAMKAP